MSQQTIRLRQTACGDIKRGHKKNRGADRPFGCFGEAPRSAAPQRIDEKT